MKTHALKYLVRLRYGDALAVDTRNEAGRVRVYGSGGAHGWHDRANTTGPVIVVGRKGSVGALHWSDDPVWVADTAYAIDRLQHPGSLRFVYYFLAQARLRGLSRDVGVPGLSRESVHGLQCPSWSKARQTAIADFLDRECERVVAAEERLGRLAKLAKQCYLASARELIISANFPSVLIKRVARPGTGHTPNRSNPAYWRENECTIPWFGLADVWQIRDDTNDVVFKTAERISAVGLANSAAVLHPAGTVIFSRTASVGFVAQMGVDMAVTQDFVTWTCGPRLLPDYLLHALRASRPEIMELVQGSTHKTIYMPDLMALKVPLPTVEEQARITRRLDDQIAAHRLIGPRRDTLSAALANYRDSLIHEAVTGKLDVARVSETEMDERLHAAAEDRLDEVVA